MKIEHILPADIERRSMEIIEEELGDIILPTEEKDIIKRVVHTTADFDYVRNLRFSPNAIRRGLEALKHGCTIVTDTNMAWAAFRILWGILFGRVLHGRQKGIFRIPFGRRGLPFPDGSRHGEEGHALV